MVVVCAYYRDGGHPELRFFPDGASQVSDLALYFTDASRMGQDFLVYEITSLEKAPDSIYPIDERITI